MQKTTKNKREQNSIYESAIESAVEFLHTMRRQKIKI